MNYIKIDTEDVCNGNGLRVVIWLSSCNHHCYNCQNPQTWNPDSGIPFDENAEEELFRELDKDYISGLTLTGGDPLHENNLDKVLDIVTKFRKRYGHTQDVVCDGEKSHNILSENSDKSRVFSDKTIWLYSGYTWEDIWDESIHYHIKTQENLKRGRWRRQQIIKLCDVFIDGRYIDSQRDITLKFKGSCNQRVINVQESLKQNKVILYCD